MANRNLRVKCESAGKVTRAGKVKISGWHDILAVLKATRNFNYYSVKK